MKDVSRSRGSDGAKRKRRSRPLPKWLTGSELDEVARRRCLVLLSVLSGERTVSDVVEELSISRQMYYLLETRALNAMLGALLPGAESSSTQKDAASPHKRIEELEAQVKKLERARRRSEHLLYLTRQVIGRGPVKTKAGRPSTKEKPLRTRSKTDGSARSPLSTSKTKRVAARRKKPNTIPPATASTPSPTPDGEVAR